MTGTRILSALFLGFACVLVLGSPATVAAENLGDPGPALLPQITGACMGLLAVILYFQGPQTPETEGEAREQAPVIVLSLLAIPVFYLMFETLGYTTAVGLYLLAAFSLLGPRNRSALLRYALAATAFSLVSGLLFGRLLEIPLPGLIP